MSNGEPSVTLRDLLENEIKFIKELIAEKESLYKERHEADTEAVKAAFAAAKESLTEFKFALVEYKAGANEWRDTVKDLIANLRESRSEGAGKDEGRKAFWGYLVGAVGLIISIIEALLLFHK